MRAGLLDSTVEMDRELEETEGSGWWGGQVWVL